MDIKSFGDLQKIISRLKYNSDPQQNDKVLHEAGCLWEDWFPEGDKEFDEYIEANDSLEIRFKNNEFKPKWE